MKKLTEILRKFHVFPMMLLAVWNLFVCLDVIFLEPYAHVILRELPEGLLWLATCLYVCVGLGILWNYLRDKDSRWSYRIAFIWHFVLPIVLGVFVMATADILYDFHSDFMPGLAALGVAVSGFILAVMSLIGGVIFAILDMIGRKRRAQGKKIGKHATIILEALDLVSFFAAIVFVLYLIYSVAFPVAELVQSAVRERKEAEFVRYVTDNHSQETLDDLYSTSLMTIYAVQMVVDEGFPEEELEEMIPSASIWEEGINKYRAITSIYQIDEKVDGINQFVHYDYKSARVLYCYELKALHVKGEYYTTVWAVVSYTKDLEMQGIHFVEDSYLHQFL